LDTYHTTIWQFYSLDRYLNTAVVYLNKYLRLGLKPLKYMDTKPVSFFDKVRLIPYWAHIFMMKLLGAKDGYDEINIVAIKE